MNRPDSLVDFARQVDGLNDAELDLLLKYVQEVIAERQRNGTYDPEKARLQGRAFEEELIEPLRNSDEPPIATAW